MTPEENCVWTSRRRQAEPEIAWPGLGFEAAGKTWHDWVGTAAKPSTIDGPWEPNSGIGGGGPPVACIAPRAAAILGVAAEERGPDYFNVKVALMVNVLRTRPGVVEVLSCRGLASPSWPIIW